MTTELKHVNEGNPLRLNDTRWLQLESLDRFAAELGYTRIGGRFHNPDNPKRVYMSFKGMSRLHNVNFSVKCFRTVKISDKTVIHSDALEFYKGVFTLYQMLKAINKKIVKQTKLEYNKRTKQIIVNDNQVKFT